MNKWWEQAEEAIELGKDLQRDTWYWDYTYYGSVISGAWSDRLTISAELSYRLDGKYAVWNGHRLFIFTERPSLPPDTGCEVYQLRAGETTLRDRGRRLKADILWKGAEQRLRR
jgi:hypothetical protein